MAETVSAVDEIVMKHKMGGMAFHVAYDLLIDTFDLEPDVALNLLHPPIGKDDWQIDSGEPKVIEAIYEEE